MAKVQAGSIMLNYERQGSGEVASHVVVVAVADTRCLDPHQDLLRARRSKIHLLDQRDDARGSQHDRAHGSDQPDRASAALSCDELGTQCLAHLALVE